MMEKDERMRNGKLRLPEFDAVIFDMDGSLVDSMWIWHRIDEEYLGKFGIALPEDLQKQIEGMSFTETAQYFKSNFPIPDSLEQMKQDWNRMAYEKYCTQVPYKKGAREFLDWCREHGKKMGVATSNSRELVNAAGEALGFDAYFDCIMTACEAKKGKPAPDIYLAVAERLGVCPERCVVFEDILPGIQAGQAAGMKVVAVEDAYSAKVREDKKQLADYYIEDFRDLAL